MTLDLPTLSFAVVLMMGLATFVLFTHWMANRKIEGLATAAAGMLFITFGAVDLFQPNIFDGDAYVIIGEASFLTGFGLVWLGTAAFWKKACNTRKRLMQMSLLLGGIIILYGAMNEPSQLVRLSPIYLLVAGFSAVTVLAVVRASGGLKLVYKGLVRRTGVGAFLTILIFSIHALYSISAAAILYWGAFSLFDVLQWSIIVRVEIMLFSASFALIIIIMTVERLQAELREQQMIDPLTGALNRSSFLEVLRAVLARARRNTEPVSLIMIDIDRFKQVNIAHGRAVGDQALKDITALMMQGRRSQDVLCRFGGEEFVLMLPGSGEEGTAIVAERIKHRISYAALAPLGVPVAISVSMGSVTARGDDLEVDGMLDMVDRKMIHAQKMRFEKIESLVS